MFKKLIFISAIFLFTSICYAGPLRFCKWDEENQVSYDCKTAIIKVMGDKKLVVFPADRDKRHDIKMEPEEKLNANGMYRQRYAKPEIGPNQRRGKEKWDFDGKRILFTHEVVDLSKKEIDEMLAQGITDEVYALWKTMMLTNPNMTIEKMRSNKLLSEKAIKAFEARERLNSK